MRSSHYSVLFLIPFLQDTFFSQLVQNILKLCVCSYQPLQWHDEFRLLLHNWVAIIIWFVTNHHQVNPYIGTSETDVAIGRGQDQSLQQPLVVQALLNEEVLEVAAGPRHTVVRLASKESGVSDLRAFGCNVDGQLGLPWMSDQGDKSLPASVEEPSLACNGESQ